jgi:hypothetical protein
MITIGKANLGEVTLPVAELSDWQPKKITFSGDSVYFNYDDTFYTMPKRAFIEIFPNASLNIK